MTALLILLVLWQGVFELALPGYRFSFPRDHGNHPRYKLEWWYWTGHLTAEEGRRFGFELAFFRLGVRRNPKSSSSWALGDLYPAHFALTDVETGRFLHYQKLSRTSPGMAGSQAGTLEVWNQQWRARLAEGKLLLEAGSREAAIDLTLDPLKAPVIHGQQGVSQKGDLIGQASHYYSLTRLQAEGSIRLHDEVFQVRGLAWMDHEFGTSQLSSEQIGWDWFSLQLDNQFEIMLYQLRRKDGSLDRNSAGTVVFPDGEAVHLSLGQFQVESTRDWTSPDTGILYPLEWVLEIPEFDCQLKVIPLLDGQELDTRSSTGIVYWEGAVEIKGRWQGTEVLGVGYVELTGYGDGGRPPV